MSNNHSRVEFEKFKQLYQDYISYAVEFHNCYIGVVNGDGYHSPIALNNKIKFMTRLLTDIKRQSIKVRKENDEIKKMETFKKKPRKKPVTKAEEWERSRWTIPPEQL